MATSLVLQVLVSPLLGTVFNNLSSLIQSEFSLFRGVQKDLNKLSSTVSTILAVIQDAEDMQITDKQIVDWLRKLKDAAYDAEDVLDECATEALARAESAEAVENGKCKIEVLNKSFSSCFVFKQILFRRAIGRRIKDLIERFDEIANEKDKFHLKHNSVSNIVEDRVRQRETCPQLVEPQVYGRDDEKEYIVDLLVKNTVNSDDPQGGVDLSVCPILGMGGLGKTTLAQMVYNDERIANHFEVRCWVCVSENFDLHALLRDIIESSGGKAQHVDKLNKLQRLIEETLKGKKFFLVLDDVWNEDQTKWDKLKSFLACGGRGSSIIVTTRLLPVARLMGTLPTCCPKILSDEQCWSLLRHRAFGIEMGECPSELEAIGKEIVKKCGGIPLAAKALGGLLRFKNEEREWKFVRDSKIWVLPQDKEDAILPALMLSYNHLPWNSKQCFAYCSIFPKDYVMKKEKLIQLWMANGFIPAKERGMKLEDIGSEIYNDLLLRFFFQEPYINRYGNIESCKMHDLVHDLACSITANECSVIQSANVEDMICRSPRHLSLNFKKGKAFVAYFESSAKSHLQLRTFLLMNRQFFYQYPQPPSLSKLRCLRVLDLNRMGITTFPLSICELKHLRYLDLSHNYIKSLPDSICKLKNLQTLILSYSVELQTVPKNMYKMTSLRYLYMDGCLPLKATPIGLGKLTSLQTLSVLIVGLESGCGINELQGLNQLRGKLEIRGLENVRDLMDAKSANLMTKENLHSLGLSWGYNHKLEENSSMTAKEVQQEELMEEGLQPHPNIRRVSIENYGGMKIPSWMMSLLNLVEVTLTNCRRCERLPPLGQLPLLSSLSIIGMDSLKCVGDEFCGDRGFPSLTTLQFIRMPKLEKLWSHSSSRHTLLFPKLKHLDISIFPKLVTCIPFPSSIKYLTFSLIYEVIPSQEQSMKGMKILLQNLTSLVRLEFSKSYNLKSLPIELLQNLTDVQNLILFHC